MIVTPYANAIALAEQVEANAKAGKFISTAVQSLARITKGLARKAQRGA
jgi:hypothetical protein